MHSPAASGCKGCSFRSSCARPRARSPKAGWKYELVAGFHRVAAAAELRLREIPVVIRESGRDAAAATENIARKQLNPQEEANAVKAMLDRGLTEDGAAQALGWPKARITARVKILELPERAQEMIGAGVIALSAVDQLRAIGRVSPPLLDAVVAFLADGNEWAAERLVREPGWVLDRRCGRAASRCSPPTWTRSALARSPSCGSARRPRSCCAEAEKLHKQITPYAYGPPPIRFNEEDVDQARAAGVLIEFERGRRSSSTGRCTASSRRARSSGRSRSCATAAELAEETQAGPPARGGSAGGSGRGSRARAGRAAARAGRSGARGEPRPRLRSPERACRPWIRDRSTLRNSTSTRCSEATTALVCGQAGEPIHHLAVARDPARRRRVPHGRDEDARRRHTRPAADRLRRPAEPDAALEWLWRYVDGARTAGELYGRGLVVAAGAVRRAAGPPRDQRAYRTAGGRTRTSPPRRWRSSLARTYPARSRHSSVPSSEHTPNSARRRGCRNRSDAASVDHDPYESEPSEETRRCSRMTKPKATPSDETRASSNEPSRPPARRRWSSCGVGIERRWTRGLGYTDTRRARQGAAVGDGWTIHRVSRRSWCYDGRHQQTRGGVHSAPGWRSRLRCQP